MGRVIIRPKDIRAAAHRIRKMVRTTPVLETDDGFLKLENFQRTGAYKVRGASNAILSMLERGSWKSVVAASAGNHAAGVAWAAQAAGIQATVVVPHNTPQVKIKRCQDYQCMVIQDGNSVDEALDIAKQLARRQGLQFLHPFENPDVIAGQGTIGLELLNHEPDVILVPIGGGGLASGIGLACAQSKTKVIGVQVEGVDSMRRSINELPRLDALQPTVADGISVAYTSPLTERLCKHYLDDIITVNEQEIIETMVRLASENNIIVEGAGAIAACALPKVPGRKKIAVVTGGNIDLQVFSELLLHQSIQRVA
jgi:threonine dehydratase